MLPIKIAGLGCYLPPQRMTSAELARQLGLPAGTIERQTGIRERRYAVGETSVSMGAAASREALHQAGLAVNDLDAIIGASTGPQQLIPCTAALLQRELQAPEGRSMCFDMNATCLSFLVALDTAAHLIMAGVYRTVLIVSSEITSRSLNTAAWESAVLFGDAAAAAIVTRSTADEASTIWQARFATHSSGADLTRFLGGGTLHHPNDPATTPEMNMFEMQGPAIFRQAVRVIRPFLDQFFASLSWDRQELALVIPHQASGHAVEQLSGRLGFRPEQVYSNLAVRGNCIAASIPLALTEAVTSGRIQRGDRLLLTGTGAGLSVGALAMTF